MSNNKKDSKSNSEGKKSGNFLDRLSVKFLGGADYNQSPYVPPSASRAPADDEHIGGRRLIAREEAARIAASNIAPSDPGIPFGGIRVPSETHFIFAGQSRSGKTLLMKRLMADILPGFGLGRDQRALIYDPVGDNYSWLHGVLGDRVPIVLLDPFDARCLGWKLSDDVRDQAAAATIAQVFVPDEHDMSSNASFFKAAAREVVTGVMEFLLERNRELKRQGWVRIDWDLRDVCNGLRDQETLRLILPKYPHTKDLVDAFVDRANADVMAEIYSKMRILFQSASAWDGRPKQSLTEFINNKDGKIIVLRGNPAKRAALEAINRAIFERFSQIHLDPYLGQNQGKRTWLFIDEFATLGKMEMMSELLKTGIKRGIRTVLAYQNFHDIVETYQGGAKTIFSEVGSIAFLQMHDEAAMHAANFVGKRLVKRTMTSNQITLSQGQPQIGRTVNEHYSPEEWVIRPNEFGAPYLPKAGVQNGVHGYFFNHTVGNIYKHHYEWRELERVANVRSNVPDFERRDDADDLKLRFWSESELKRLNLPVKSKKSDADSERDQILERLGFIKSN